MKSLILALTFSLFTLPSFALAEGKATAEGKSCAACADGKSCDGKSCAACAEGKSCDCKSCAGKSAPATTTATPAPGAVPTSLVVKGMHCGGCKSAVEAKVCNMPGIATCKVEITNMKKQMGKVTLTAVEGQTVDAEAVKKAIADAGYEATTAKK
jgi:copper chaperone CopZ